MLLSRRLLAVVGIASTLLTACSSVTQILHKVYSKQEQNQLYAVQKWLLDGRLAIVANKESWSANMAWQHDASLEQIKLSGPLGQGGAVIKLTKNQVIIDRGSKGLQSSENPDEFIKQQLGMAVPIHSLRYWVIGLPEPERDFIGTVDGFKQGEWLVEYKEMQTISGQILPKRVNVLNGQVKLKVVIDQWTISNEK